MKINRYDLIILFTFTLLLLGPIYNIGKDVLDLSKFYIAGIPASDIALLIMLVIFIFNIKQITNFTRPKLLGLIGFVIIFYFIQGIIINGTSNFAIYNAEIRTWFWFYGGIGFAYSLLKTGKPIRYLKMIIIVATFLLIVSSIKSEGFTEYMNGWSTLRVGHQNIYILSGWIVTPIIILLNVTSHKISKMVIPIASIASFFIFVGIISNTRSSMIIAFVLFLLLSISLKFNIRESVLLISKIRRRDKIILAILASLLVVYFVYYNSIERKIRLLSIFDIEVILSDSRFFELKSFFGHSDIAQLFFGRGFGGSVPSPIYEMRLTSTLHIGILNFWMKLGVFPFLIISYYLFINIPARYLKSFKLITHNRSNYYHTANVVILSTLFPWLFSLLLSGGYGETNFLFAGFTVYAYGMVKKQGLKQLIKR
ncbi:MAG: hypothetical protein HQ521_04110 [Bacteroidetes bacterium]|nr:hypothetical protein [Bacteroidota bacterium]